MRKYSMLLGVVILGTGLVGCDSHDIVHEMVAVMFVVEGHGPYAAGVVAELEAVTSEVEWRLEAVDLPFNHTAPGLIGAIASLSATVEAPESESGFRIAMYANGELIAEERADGSAGGGVVTRTLSASATLR